MSDGATSPGAKRKNLGRRAKLLKKDVDSGTGTSPSRGRSVSPLYKQ
jgi:hypothetical protein